MFARRHSSISQTLLCLAFLGVAFFVMTAVSTFSGVSLAKIPVQIVNAQHQRESNIRYFVKPGQKISVSISFARGHSLLSAHPSKDANGSPLFASLVSADDPSFILHYSASQSTAEQRVFAGDFHAPLRETLLDFNEWFPLLEGGNAKRNAAQKHFLQVAVTCSNNIFCDGIERLVNGVCVTDVSKPCDDHDNCTTDSCSEFLGGTCSHQLAKGCSTCNPNCTPNCTNLQCGNDGCGGSCGNCSSSDSCVAGVCEALPSGGAGDCNSPFPLLSNVTDLIGTFNVAGDTSLGRFLYPYTCDSVNGSQQLVYQLNIPEGNYSYLGLEIRSAGFDTVLMAYDTYCGNASSLIVCDDDAFPPGNGGSRLNIKVFPGKTYFFLIGGYDDTSFGPFEFTMIFSPECIPNCDGTFCADDGCGGLCGSCPNGQACFSGTCYPSPCIANCTNRTCGDDGCGGLCGLCPINTTCLFSIDPITQDFSYRGICSNPLPVCSYKNPVCSNCSASQFCDSNCECVDLGSPRADLVLDLNTLLDDLYIEIINITRYSCSFIENCVADTGVRALLRFPLRYINQGTNDLVFPTPIDQHPETYQYGVCHNHYHIKDFVSYYITDLNGKNTVIVRKQTYCVTDSFQVYESPSVNCTGIYGCFNPGIQKGWGDEFDSSLDCQWIDITDSPSGNFHFIVTINTAQRYTELSFDNNMIDIIINVPTLNLTSLQSHIPATVVNNNPTSVSGVSVLAPAAVWLFFCLLVVLLFN